MAPLVGLAYRFSLHEEIVARIDHVDVLELTVDHYFEGDVRERTKVDSLAGEIPVVLHGVGLSVGTDCPLDRKYLDGIVEVVERFGAGYYSEHLAFTRVSGRDTATLLPLPRNLAVADRVIENVKIVQDILPVPLLLENIPYYFDYVDSDMDDVDFLNHVCTETGAEILLDLQNLYVNSKNRGIDGNQFIDKLPDCTVRAVHIAGGVEVDGILVDDHGHAVHSAVFDLVDCVLARQAPEVLILERDQRLENVEEIFEDLDGLKRRVQEARYLENEHT
jgi:uncharacterized protein